MALFKIKRGLKANLPTTYNEGYCYVTTDDGKFYIDTSNAASGRIVLNAEHADTATTLSTTRYIDGIAFNGDNNVSRYGTCSTAAATVAKTVTLGGGAFSLTTGARVLVKFTVTNTASSPTLNVNGTGEKAIRYRGSAISKGYLAATRVYEFVYDGTAWELIGDINTNTTYSAATASKLGLIKVGNGLSIDTNGVLSHADTNGSVSNLTAASRTYITSLTFDEYGHVTGYNVGTETVTNTDTHHTAYIYLGNSTATSNATSAVTDPYINLIENGSKRSGIQFKAGSGITVSGVSGIVTISHADNSSVQNLTANGRTYVTGLTFDAFGHVTGYSVGSETVTNTHHTAYVRLGSSTATANATTAVSDPYIVLVENGANRSGVQLKAGSGITISGINGIATISHADNSAVQNLTASGRRYVTGLTFDAFGHVTAYTTGTETITDTHYTTAIKVGASGTNSNSEATNPYIKVLDNTTYRSQIQLAGSGLTTVTSNASGKVTIDTTINGTAVTTALGYVPDTPAQVDAKIAALVDSAPSTLNTLNELAAALGDDANFSTTVTNLIGTKISSVTASGTAPLTLSASTDSTTKAVTISGSVANASTTSAGVVTTGTQTFAGAKYFDGGLWGTAKTSTSSTPFYILPKVPYGLVDETHTDNVYFEGLLKWICENYSISNAIVYTLANPNSQGYAHIQFYSTGNVDSTTGLPQYSSGVYYALGGGITRFGTNNYTYYCYSSSLTDTKNTAGSTNTSSKIFLIGATSQASNPTTYSHDTVYVDTNGHLYSNSKQVVNLSDSQALTNKTYNGYTLAAACAKAVTDSSSASAISTGTSLPTERDIYYGLPTINNSHSYTSSTTIYAPSAGGTAGQYLKAVGATSTPTWASFAALTVKSKNIAGIETTKATYTPSTAATATIGPDDLFEIYSYSVTEALSLNTWTDIATAANLGSPATGTYIIQVTAGGAVYSGVMTWDATTTAVSGLYDEVLLHSASTSTAHVTARVNRDSSLRLQLCALDAAVASGTITVKMRRMI